MRGAHIWITRKLVNGKSGFVILFDPAVYLVYIICSAYADDALNKLLSAGAAKRVKDDLFNA